MVLYLVCFGFSRSSSYHCLGFFKPASKKQRKEAVQKRSICAYKAPNIYNHNISPKCFIFFVVGVIFTFLFNSNSIFVLVKNHYKRRTIPCWHIWRRIYKLYVQRFPVYSLEIVKTFKEKK